MRVVKAEGTPYPLNPLSGYVLNAGRLARSPSAALQAENAADGVVTGSESEIPLRTPT
jgi:hypothetical protein